MTWGYLGRFMHKEYPRIILCIQILPWKECKRGSITLHMIIWHTLCLMWLIHLQSQFQTWQRNFVSYVHCAYSHYSISCMRALKRTWDMLASELMELLSRGGQPVSTSAKSLWSQRDVCSGRLLVRHLCTQHSVIDVTNVAHWITNCIMDAHNNDRHHIQMIR